MLIVGPAHSIVVTKREAPYVIIDTSMGKITVELYWDHAPKTCQNFASLAARGYYNNTKFHRIIPDFMVQVSVCLPSLYLCAPSITLPYSFCKRGCVRACCVCFPLSITLGKARHSKSRTHTHTTLKTLTQLANIREATLQQLEKVEIQYMDPSSRMSCTGSALMIWPELKHFERLFS